MAAMIGPEGLAAILHDPDLVLLDIRSAVDGGGRAAYEAGHIPGALHTDYVAGGWRVAGEGGGAGLLPGADHLAGLFGALGIRPESRVVVVPAGVSAGDFAAGARVYWTIKAAGHAGVSMLDGGHAGWVAAGQRVETGPAPAARPGPAYPVRLDPSLRATLGDVERAVATGSATLVDARNLRSFVGEEKSGVAARAGRIPGALHQEGAGGYDPVTNRLQQADALAAAFAGLPAGDVIPYCNTGQQAATNWFALSEILGRPGVRLYDGSLSEWTRDPARPVETGPAKA